MADHHSQSTLPVTEGEIISAKPHQSDVFNDFELADKRFPSDDASVAIAYDYPEEKTTPGLAYTSDAVYPVTPRINAMEEKALLRKIDTHM